MVLTRTRRHDPIDFPPDLSRLSPYQALEAAQLGLARARLAKDRALIQAWQEAFDAAYTQCALTGVLSE
jgi:hypothetical protein